MTTRTDLSVAADGSITLYVGGKKVLRGTLAEITQHLSGTPTPAAKPRKTKPKSRSKRWTDAAFAASAALTELRSIQEEFEDWRDSLPENLQSSALGEKLEAVCDIDLDSAISAAEDAEGADLPLGFGRD